MLSPEEKLDILYKYLCTGEHEHALEFFEFNSNMGHSRRFRLALRRLQGVKKFGEYIVLYWHNEYNNYTLFVIGLDDNYRFFCHNVPSVNSIEFPIKNERDVRNLMGFDLHLWEVNELKEDMQIRIQGDLVIRIEKIFRNEEDLYMFIKSDIVSGIIRHITSAIRDITSIIKHVSSIFPYAYYVHIFESPRFAHILRWILIKKVSYSTLLEVLSCLEILSQCQDSLEILDTLSPPAKELIVLMLRESLRELIDVSDVATNQYKLSDVINICAERIVRKIVEYERICRFRIGAHLLKIIGLYNLRDENLWFVPTISGSPRTIMLLRHQTITAYHDEHKTASLNLPPCIISINTLRTGPFHGGLINTLQTLSPLDSLIYILTSAPVVTFRQFRQESDRLPDFSRMFHRLTNIFVLVVDTLFRISRLRSRGKRRKIKHAKIILTHGKTDDTLFAFISNESINPSWTSKTKRENHAIVAKMRNHVSNIKQLGGTKPRKMTRFYMKIGYSFRSPQFLYV